MGIYIQFVTSGFCCSVREIALFWDLLQHRVVNPSRCFRTTYYQSHCQGSGRPRQISKHQFGITTMLLKFPEECSSYIQFKLMHRTLTLALVTQGDVGMLDVSGSNMCNPVKHIGLGCSCVLSMQVNTFIVCCILSG